MSEKRLPSRTSNPIAEFTDAPPPEKRPFCIIKDEHGYCAQPPSVDKPGEEPAYSRPQLRGICYKLQFAKEFHGVCKEPRLPEESCRVSKERKDSKEPHKVQKGLKHVKKARRVRKERKDAKEPHGSRKESKDGKEKHKVCKEQKDSKDKQKGQESEIHNLLQTIKDQNLINQGQLDLLRLNFGEDTLGSIENELKLQNADEGGNDHSQELKEFAVTMYFTSPQAYAFLQQTLHLPPSSTIQGWSASQKCQPGILSEVIEHLKKTKAKDSLKKHCTLMFDTMALEKEIVYDHKNANYTGFVDCGMFLSASEDSLASEALIFIVVGLTDYWKFPVAYYLVDDLSAVAQAEIIKQLICVLTEAGLVVHGVTCEGSYANQTTATMLGCSFNPEDIQAHFPHPSNPNDKVHCMFDVCHLLKLVSNCLATLEKIIHNGEEIKWSYIQKLSRMQLNDKLNLENNSRSKHLQWEQLKRRVEIPAQALSSSVVDSLDFLRDDLKHKDFAGSEKTSEFIRRVIQLFNFLNLNNPNAKGYYEPMHISNFTFRKKWLLETKKYLAQLEDPLGRPLREGRRKTAVVGLMATIDSVVQVCEDLLIRTQPSSHVQCVCTFKMSLENLKTYFIQICRTGGWTSSPNCLTFKWALRTTLLKDKVTI